MPKRVLLIDADVLLYEAASAVETALEFEPGYWTWHADFNAAREAFDQALDLIVKKLKGDEVKLCLTDSEGNFRFGILPTYKAGRPKKKPLVLKPLKQLLIDEYGAYFKPTLEGDDCMGILMTRSNPTGEERVIVSIDKDMKTIPGLFCRWGTDEDKVVEISLAEADRYHLYQTLIGDPVDGYKGCPGVGPVKANAVLDQDPSWAAVVRLYEKAGLSEEVALQQARVARILRASDYDFKERKPILWTPSTSE